MLPIAYFGINSSGVNLAINLLILFLVVVWLALVYWTYSDARRRIVDPMLIGCATAASLFPFVGTVVYMIVRPPEYLDDVRERELEMQAAEARLHELNYSLCPHCDYEVERDFLICPSCLHRLKDSCANCGRPLDQSWTVCPYCETQVPGAVPPRRRRRRETGESAALVSSGPAGGQVGSAPRSAAARSAAQAESGGAQASRRQRRAAPAGADAGGGDASTPSGPAPGSAPVTQPARVRDTPQET
jgi:RNA polymerase subunit RPABC4/transcription elongation factor Spt4